MTVYKKNGSEVKIGDVVTDSNGDEYHVEDVDQGYVYVISTDGERRKKLTATSLGLKYDPKDRERFMKARQALRDYWQA